MNTTAQEVRYKTNCAEIWLDPEGILWLKPDPNADVDEEQVKECFDIYRQLGAHSQNKVLQIIDARMSFTMTKEAREYAAKAGTECLQASAVISSSLPVRLIINFFNLFHKPTVPLKMFDSEEDARKWLSRFTT